MILSIICIVISFQSLSGAPVPPNSNSDNSEPIVFFDELNKHDYSDYMNGVLKELQEDKEFLKEIETNQGSNSVEQFAEYLNSASDNARNKLDEIKRREIARLNELEKELERTQLKDHLNPDTGKVDEVMTERQSHIAEKDSSRFTEEDLKALISRATHDINMVDMASERQYRRRQIRKRIKERQKLIETKDPEERRKLRTKYSENRKKRLSQSRVHEPGSEEQFKGVWSTQDHLDPKTFNSKTFFKLHDLNQDDHWDIAEIEALVQSDVEKVSLTDTDKVDDQEKFHETMKMRQHIMEKIDANNDQLISLDEFLHFEKTSEFKKDEEWKSSNELDSPIETDEDWNAYKDKISNILDEKIAPVDIQGDQSLTTNL